MDRKEVEYLQGLLEIFKVEAQEHINAMSNGLIELEKAKSEERPPLVETIYREAHSLKGAARAVNMAEIEGLCQKLENVFSEMKRPRTPWSPALFDALHRAVTELDTMLQAPHTTRSVAETAKTYTLYQDLENATRNPGNKPRGAAAHPAAPTPNTESPENTKGAEDASKSYEAPPSQPTKQRPAARAPRETHEQAQTVAPAPKPTPTFAQVGNTTAQPQDKPPHPAQSLVEDRGSDTIRVSTAKLDALLLQAEELLSAKLTAGYRSAELRELSATIADWAKEWSKVRSDVRTMQQTMERGEGELPAARSTGPNGSLLGNLLEFLDWNQSFVKSLEGRVAALSKASEHDQSALTGMTDTLLEDMKKVLMLPFASMLEIFPRMARDLSRSRGKDVNLVIRGGEIEIDRRILELLKDPLIHLVRNSIDHGIEEPQERIRLGKPKQATLMITVAQKDANKIEVVVSDDGAGINAQRIRVAAVKSGLITESDTAETDPAALLALIFQSGFSTSPMITDLSGRGLGLAIVREKVEKLGGTVGVESEPGAGSSFRLVLPLTLATCRGILVRVTSSRTAGVNERLFVLPTTHVERVVSVQAGDIKLVGGRETIMLDGEAVSLTRLGNSLGLANAEPLASSEQKGVTPAVVLSAGDKRIGFLVDAIVDEQEVLVKSLGPQLARVRNISGATVLGSGKVVPILNVVDLLKSATMPGVNTIRADNNTPTATKRASILVAEDSITSRTLFKNILEAAGYHVKTAIDGADALAELRAGEYDLLVSDIEMPRMNGFELVTKIRDDQNLMNLPVVLVTSLESREDREHGAEVGANAYLVKRGFDQANLLEVISRLI